MWGFKMAGQHLLSRFAVLSTVGFSLACLGSGGSDGNTAPNEGGFWNNFVDEHIVDGGGAAGSLDSDGDGLSDSEEEALGSDPNLADSDGDGWDDGEEVDGNTDPTRKNDHPYTGGWAIGDCRNDIEGTGTRPGDIVNQFELTDQYGDTVRLHDFCDREVLLVGAAFW